MATVTLPLSGLGGLFGSSAQTQQQNVLQQQAQQLLSQFTEEGGKKPSSSDPISPRRCTDIGCLLVLLASLGVMFCVILPHASAHGDLRRLHHGFDFLGHMCGVGAFEDRPYLFYCSKPMASGQLLDLAHPICVDGCPTSEATWHSCFAGHTSSFQVTDPVTQSFNETLHYAFEQVTDYPSYVFLGHYCVPRENALYNQLKEVLMNRFGNTLMEMVIELIDSWEAVVASVFIAILCGFMYLLCLEYLAGLVVYSCLILPSVAFTLLGTWLILTSQGLVNAADLPSIGSGSQALDLSAVQMLSTGMKEWDLGLGIFLVVCGFAFSLVCCFCRYSIAAAVGCIEATCDCMQQVPSLLLNPFIALLFQLVVLSTLITGFLWVMSCGDVKEEEIGHYVTTPVSEFNSLGGVARSFTYTEEEYYYMAFYIFMIFWLFELSCTISQFSLIYAVEMWYFTPYRGGSKSSMPAAPLLRGATLALQYHLGSLALGSFLVAVLRLARLIGAIIAHSQKEQGNKVASTVAGCCTCCLDCFTRFVEYVNKNAYMEVALHSKCFCDGAQAAFKLMTGELVSVAILNGVTWVLSVGALGSIATAGAFITYLMVENLSIFNEPGQDTYVANVWPVVIGAGFVSAGVAWNFMMVFDTISDTILYCFVVDQGLTKGWFNAPQYAPPSLKKLLASTRS